MKYTIGTDSIDTAKTLSGLAAYLDDDDNYELGAALGTFLSVLVTMFDGFAKEPEMSPWRSEVKQWDCIRKQCDFLSSKIGAYIAEHSTE